MYIFIPILYNMYMGIKKGIKTLPNYIVRKQETWSEHVVIEQPMNNL